MNLCMRIGQAGRILMGTGMAMIAGDTLAQAGALEEVIVTARHRSENMQETPIAVSAVSAESMREQGIKNTKDLTRSIPSLQIGKAGSVQIYIRGIGERTGFSRVDPSVGVYLDGVYIPRVDGQLFDAVELGGIQVLRGPQGTLFGKNTTGGAMLLTLAKPSDEDETIVELGAASHRRVQGKVVNGFTLSENLHARLALSAITDDGYLKDVNGQKFSTNNRQSLIGQLRWTPADNLLNDTFLYFGNINETRPGRHCNLSDDNGLFIRGLYVMFPGDTDPSNPTAWNENCLENSIDRLGRDTVSLGDAPNEYRFRSVMLGNTLELELDSGDVLKFILGSQYSVEEPHQVSDSDAGPAEFLEAFTIDDSERYVNSLELQLTGTMFDERMSYSTGLYAMVESLNDSFVNFTSLVGLDLQTLGAMGLGQRPSQPTPMGTVPVVGVLAGPLAESVFELDNQTYGAYFQGVFDVTENIQWTFGGRYTVETRSTDQVFTGSDIDAISARIALSPQFGPAVAPGFHPFLGSWAQDPVSIAASLFTDEDGDGIIDFPMDRDNAVEQKEKVTFREFSPMTSLSYVFDGEWMEDSVVDSLMAYATWSNGFKSGFFEPKGADGLKFIEPEEVENIELGIKSDWFGRRLRSNLSIYNMDYKQIQLLQISTDRNNNLQVTMDNAGAATIKGVELEMTWLPTPRLMMQFSYSRNDYSYDEFTDLELIPLAINGTRVPVDRSDESFAIVPEQTAYFGVQYEFKTDYGRIVPRVDVSYKDKIYYGIDRKSWEAYKRDESRGGVPSSTVANAMVTWFSDSGDFSVTGYVRNFTDEAYPEGGSATAETLGNFVVTPGEPRVYGIEFRKVF